MKFKTGLQMKGKGGLGFCEACGTAVKVNQESINSFEVFICCECKQLHISTTLFGDVLDNIYAARQLLILEFRNKNWRPFF